MSGGSDAVLKVLLLLLLCTMDSLDSLLDSISSETFLDGCDWQYELECALRGGGTVGAPNVCRYLYLLESLYALVVDLRSRGLL